MGCTVGDTKDIAVVVSGTHPVDGHFVVKVTNPQWK